VLGSYLCQPPALLVRRGGYELGGGISGFIRPVSRRFAERSAFVSALYLSTCALRWFAASPRQVRPVLKYSQVAGSSRSTTLSTLRPLAPGETSRSPRSYVASHWLARATSYDLKFVGRALTRARLKSKPRQYEVNARAHRSRGEPSTTTPARSVASIARGNNAATRPPCGLRERPWPSSHPSTSRQAYQYITGTAKPIAGRQNISRMVRAQKDNANRGTDGEQCGRMNPHPRNPAHRERASSSRASA
jgi:hypothetical protein